MLLTHVQLEALPEDEAFAVKYERFINEKGKIDGNIEKDRAMEYRIGKTKEFLSRLNSNFKEPFVKNLTKSIDKFQDITEKLQEDLKVRKVTSKHKNPSREKEIKLLVDFLLGFSLFRIQNNRNGRGEKFQENLLNFNRKTLEKWAKETTKEFGLLTCFNRNEEEFDYLDYDIDEYYDEENDYEEEEEEGEEEEDDDDDGDEEEEEEEEEESEESEDSDEGEEEGEEEEEEEETNPDNSRRIRRRVSF